MNTTEQPPKDHVRKKASVNLKALALQMERLAQLDAKVRGGTPDKEFLKMAMLTASGIFRLVVIGEIKKGKSSFINALLGTENLVPVHSDVATSTIFKIHYGKELKYTVYFEDAIGKEKLVIQPGEVDDYGTERGNPGNKKQVDYIRVESPSPLLTNGLIIVDTPGVGGLFKEHREITFRHVPNADAVFFVTESDGAPLGEDEVEFLKELRQVTSLISFIQTKSTKVDGDARKKRMENNVKILREQVGIPGKELTYFIVDSKLKIAADQKRDADDLNFSGFGPVVAYLNNTLRRNQEINAAKRSWAITQAKLGPLAAHLSERRRILDADTTEKRTGLQKELEHLQSQLTEWEKSSKPLILEQFKKGMNSLVQSTTDKLSPLQPSGPIYSEFSSRIWEAENADQLKIIVSHFSDNLAALASSACVKICGEATTEATRLIEELTKDVLKTMTHGKGADLVVSDLNTEALWVSTDALERVVAKEMSGGFFEEARTSMYGGMAGIAIAQVVGGLVGSVIPVVGTIAGSWVGGVVAAIWGGRVSTEIATKQKLDAMKQQADAALNQTLSTAYQSAAKQVNRLLTEMQMEATSLLQKILQQANEELIQKREDINKRQRATQAEVKESQQNVASWESELQGIQKSLGAFRVSLPA
jgi:gas vesicle protein/cytochrome c556/GTP-binding protein EngB required for normal cell division